MLKKLVALTILVFSAWLAFGQGRKYSRDFQTTSSTAPVNVIVQFTRTPTQGHFQKVFSRGGVLRRNLQSIRGGAFQMPASAIAALAQDPQVAYISPDRPVRVMMDNDCQSLVLCITKYLTTPKSAL